MSADGTTQSATKPVRRKYVKAVGPQLRKLLYVVFALAALLAANSGYLTSITALEWMSGQRAYS